MHGLPPLTHLGINGDRVQVLRPGVARDPGLFLIVHTRGKPELGRSESKRTPIDVKVSTKRVINPTGLGSTHIVWGHETLKGSRLRACH